MSAFIPNTAYDWSDIIPIPQEDNLYGLVSIKYNPEYRKNMDIFRAIIRKGEYSPRVLQLTEDILNKNAANYTVWQYRRDCLRALDCNIESEFEFMDSFSEDNPKNYQIWYHRRAIVEMSNNPSRELQFCAKVFEVDAKNYHAWSHRQWVLSNFDNLWHGELEYVEKLIDDDMRNNSAWNQRWFVIHNCPLIQISKEVLNIEVQYCFDALNKLKLNESAWNYARGLQDQHPEVKSDILIRTESLLRENETNIHALGLIGEIMESCNTHESLTRAEYCYSMLVNFDKIRCKYWNRRVNEVQQRIINVT